MVGAPAGAFGRSCGLIVPHLTDQSRMVLARATRPWPAFPTVMRVSILYSLIGAFAKWLCRQHDAAATTDTKVAVRIGCLFALDTQVYCTFVTLTCNAGCIAGAFVRR